MPRDTMASLRAELDALKASIASTPAAPSEASQHYTERDLPCTLKPRCAKTFRTVKGQTWHAANMQAAHKAK